MTESELNRIKDLKNIGNLGFINSVKQNPSLKSAEIFDQIIEVYIDESIKSINACIDESIKAKFGGLIQEDIQKLMLFFEQEKNRLEKLSLIKFK